MARIATEYCLYFSISYQ